MRQLLNVASSSVGRLWVCVQTVQNTHSPAIRVESKRQFAHIIIMIIINVNKLQFGKLTWMQIAEVILFFLDWIKWWSTSLGYSRRRYVDTSMKLNALLLLLLLSMVGRTAPHEQRTIWWIQFFPTLYKCQPFDCCCIFIQHSTDTRYDLFVYRHRTSGVLLQIAYKWYAQWRTACIWWGWSSDRNGIQNA